MRHLLISAQQTDSIIKVIVDITQGVLEDDGKFKVLFTDDFSNDHFENASLDSNGKPCTKPAADDDIKFSDPSYT